MAKLNTLGLRALRGDFLMFARIAFLGGVLASTLFCYASVSRGENGASEANASNAQTPPAGAMPAVDGQTQSKEETIEIPLESIWGLDIPGTRDIEGLDLPKASSPGWGYTELKRQRDEAIQSLRRSLSIKPPADDAQTGFLVYGPITPISLHNLAGLLNRADSETRAHSVEAGKEVYLVFYSHPSSYYLRLKSVQKRGNEITVTYTFEPHYSVESTAHLALIPLGGLKAGEYRVNIVQEEMDKKYIKAGFIQVLPGQAKRYISQPFSFKVYEVPAATPIAGSSAEVIPLEQIWALDMAGTRDVRDLSGDNAARIRRTLTRRTGEKAKAGSCFFVMGEGEEALGNAANVIADGGLPLESVPAEKEVSLIFYSYAAPGYVTLDSVTRAGDHVAIRYQVITHQSLNMTVHFAIIPLGALSSGRITVETIEVASDTPYSNHSLTERAVCDSCTMTIE